MSFLSECKLNEGRDYANPVNPWDSTDLNSICFIVDIYKKFWIIEWANDGYTFNMYQGVGVLKSWKKKKISWTEVGIEFSEDFYELSGKNSEENSKQEKHSV